jgi:hypothetical protein
MGKSTTLVVPGNHSTAVILSGMIVSQSETIKTPTHYAVVGQLISLVILSEALSS